MTSDADLGAPKLDPGETAMTQGGVIAEIRDRAAAGALIVVARGVVVMAIGLTGSLVLARLLLPSELGVVAVGTTIVMLGYVLAEGGLGATLIRSPSPPDREDMEALFAFQLCLMSVLALGIAAVGLLFGQIGHVTALMALALPISAFRTPGTVLLERELNYSPLALVGIGETVVYYGWAVSTVALGWGVWGLASAALIRAAVGSCGVVAVSPVRFLWPRLRIARVRRLVGFGMRYQAAGGIVIVRDQVLLISTAAIAGVTTVGLYSLAKRLLEVPNLLFRSLWRVSFPAMSRLIASGEDPRRAIERTVALLTVGGGAILVPLVGSSPALVPAVVGVRWEDATLVMPTAGLAVLIYGPMGAAASGFLWASGNSRAPLLAQAFESVTWCLLAVALVPFIGVAALGLSWLVGAIAFAFVLDRSARRAAGARLVRPVLAPLAAAVAGGTAAWVLADAGAQTLSTAIVAALFGEVVFLAALLVVRRTLLADTLGLAGRTLRLSLGRGT